MDRPNRLRFPLSTLCLLVAAVALGISLALITARHNAQIRAMTAAHNAQLAEMTARHNDQLLDMTARHNAQLEAMAADPREQAGRPRDPGPSRAPTP